MDPNQYKKPRQPSSSDSDSKSDDQEIFGDDLPKTIKVSHNNINTQSHSPSPAPIVQVFISNEPIGTCVDNQKHSQSQKNSSMSTKTRPQIYDEAQTQKDNQGYNQRLNRYDNRNPYEYRYDREERGPRRNYGPNRTNHSNINRNRNWEFHQDNQFRNDYNQQNHNHQYSHNTNYQGNQNFRNHRQQFEHPNHRRNYNQNNQQKYHGHNQKFSNRHLPRNDHPSKRQNNHNNHFQTQNPIRNNPRSQNQQKQLKNHHHRQNSSSNSKQTLSKRKDSYQSHQKSSGTKNIYKSNARNNQPQIKPQKQSIVNNQKQRKEEQLQTKLQHKASSRSAQQYQNNSGCLNKAISNITVQNQGVLPTHGNNKLQESSVWQPSDEEDKDQSKQQQKSSFQCHQISIEYPSLPPVINRNDHNMSSFTQEISILQALKNSNLDMNETLQKDPIIIQPIAKKEEKRPTKIQQHKNESNSLFSANDLIILQKMFDQIPSQGQCLYVQIRVKTDNICSYKVKNLSSELYLFENTTPQQLKCHKLISIKECEKAVPRDNQPYGLNRQFNQKIQLKTSKINLAQIKNPLQLLNHKEHLLQKFNSLEELELIGKIQNNQKAIIKLSTLINIEQVTLKCSSCNGKKSFLWNDQIISQQCKVQCANFLRFKIDSMSIC